MSVGKENTPCKSTKISDESRKENICTISRNEEILVEKIRLRVSEQMDLNADLFNEKLESLKRRLKQLERTNVQEEITKTLLNERKGREKLINEENHNYGEDFQAISTSSSKEPHLAFLRKLAEKVEDPSPSSKLKEAFV